VVPPWFVALIEILKFLRDDIVSCHGLALSSTLIAFCGIIGVCA